MRATKDQIVIEQNEDGTWCWTIISKNKIMLKSQTFTLRSYAKVQAESFMQRHNKHSFDEIKIKDQITDQIGKWTKPSQNNDPYGPT